MSAPSAPYWGQLPEPNVAKRNNRASLQSTVTTQSTFSPRAPAAEGLAPRPPSFTHSAPHGPVLDASPSTDREDVRLLPPAPAPLRGPDSSFRHGRRGDDSLQPSPAVADAQISPSHARAVDEPYPEAYDGQDLSYQRPVYDVSARRDGPDAATQPVTGSHRRRIMTKEEKRARVEAAEQRARRRASLRAAESSSNSQTIQPASVTQSLSLASTIYALHEEAAASRAPTQPSQNGVRLDQEPLVPDAPPDFPARNLSFRERAVRNEVSLPDKEIEHQWSAPTRETSRKLTKEPPGGTNHRHRRVAESSPAAGGQPTPSQTMQPKLLPLSTRNKRLPPVPSPSPDLLVPQLPGDGGRHPPRETARGIDSTQVGPHGVLGGQHVAVSAGSKGPRGPADNAPAPDPPAYEASELQGSHHASRPIFKAHDDRRPRQGFCEPPRWMDEWSKATTGTLSGALLDLGYEQPSAVDTNRAWWETSGQGNGAIRPPKQRRAEAFDGEYDDTNGPTRFKPPLYLQCGPLLRYCGLRRERFPMRPQGDGDVLQREIWRGSVLIITKDSESSYEIAPMLRLFVQNVQLLPPPPQQVDGELPPEYVDPIAGHPKLGRRGETLYVRPVEHLAEGRDLSRRDESSGGLFEATRSPPDVPSADGSPDPPGSLARRIKAADADGEKMQKYKDVRGFRLHAERGRTFWRFNIEVELRERQQRIAYRINRGPCSAFWVPARGQTMNMMFYSCNGFGAGARPDELSGPDPLWRDVLNTHQTQPFHVMIGGGNQIYNDGIADESDLLANWLFTHDASDGEEGTAFTAEMQDELETLYLDRYCMWFSQGLYGLATSQIPMVNMYDDHDVLDGYLAGGPVFGGLGAVAFKYYMLFQHQSLPTETESSEPSWILGLHPGSYIHELSRSVFVSLGGRAALLAVDCRTERTESTVVRETTWEKMMNRLYAEIRRGQMDHLLVLSALPVAFPRSDDSFASKLMNPVKTIGRATVFGSLGDETKGEAGEQWIARAHRRERSIIIEDLQDLAIDKSMRITILSGNVNMAAIGQFYSNPKLSLAKHRDPRYMPNIISSAVANVPPSDRTADVINKRSKVRRFDKQTDEGMIPLFRHDIDGRQRSNAHLLPRRNWCSIRQWVPGHTPPPTPPPSGDDASRSPAPVGGGIFRRLSSRRRSSAAGRFDGSRESARDSRPPVSGLLGSLSRRKSTGAHQPTKLRRSMSLGVGGRKDRGYLGTGWRTDEGRRRGGEDDDGYAALASRPSIPRTHDEFTAGDETNFSTAKGPRRAQSMGSRPNQFHRTPTGLSAKQMQQADRYAVDLEGGLEVTVNVEVNGRDPAGITVPYRLLVPRLQYEYDPVEDDLGPRQEASGLRRLLSLGRRPGRDEASEGSDEYSRR
ncbi:hypothetical protein XA68_17373 [Ophiocordyceps unilateralis]|uniref:PhoD-like phosphatase domain-containing protein n=1 Tax=Ophiocordyceps unilateralis TaxID=268505 RepID=A0A2A9P511_OPHUN|nr:hypothetical protein XA68_17373 [Ophiocordyceps unilateralis]